MVEQGRRRGVPTMKRVPATIDHSAAPVGRVGPCKDHSSAAGRMLAVLEAFGPEHSSLTLSEISRRSGLSLTTTHRLVGELRDWGALERAPDGRYGIGLRRLGPGAPAPPGRRRREPARPSL